MSPRVLVIDDKADIREITEMTLARIGGWDVIGADNGRTGAERWRPARLPTPCCWT